jgi:hypothetical protein
MSGNLSYAGLRELAQELTNATSAEAITPADSDFATPIKGLWVGGVGDVTATLVDDSVAVTFEAVAAGTYLPIQVKRIAAATTATKLVGLR